MTSKKDLIAAMQADSEHHLFSASGSSQWLSCGMSIWEQFGMPDTTSDAAIEGTAAHNLAEMCLKENLRPSDVDGVTEEMAEFVGKYIDYVKHVVEDGRMWIEQRIDLNKWIMGGRGTADIVAICSKTLHIIDLKYGKGVQVFAEDNSQLKLYALGALDRFLETGIEVEKVVVHICQPRLYHYQSAELGIEELLAFGEHVSKWIQRCLDKEVDYNPSERACQWCKAQATCSALYQHNLKVISEDFAPIPAGELTDEQLKLVVDNKPLIEKWLKSVEAHVFSRLERGEKFEGYKMVEGRSIRKYTANAAEVLEKILGENAYEKKLINLSEAEKAVGKKQFAELGITVKPAGKPTLVPESDKRKAISVSDDFEKLEKED